MEYITTPIYYLNGFPHIGSSYTSIAADIIARFKRLHGDEVFFLTGTDEHGMKVAQSAEKAGLTSQEFCDQMAEHFKELTQLWSLTNDDFIRTTEQRHIKSAQAFWKTIEHDIYLNNYRGWYDVRDEAFVQESDVKDGKGPSGGPVTWMEEESFFFKLSEYQDKLLKYYDEHPDFIAPESKKNEVISFVKEGLKDLCISRTRFTWGIPVPEHENHIMYVWIDALTNYISALGYPNLEKVTAFFSNCIHLVGKEILRFHAVYWPAFLMAAGLPLPKRIFAHGWLTSEGQKMSKSVGNVVYPQDVIAKYTADVVRFYLFREIRFGEDGDFSDSAVEKRVNYDLANDLGNLVQRVLSFPHKMGIFTPDYSNNPECSKLIKKSRELPEILNTLIDKQDLSGALDKIWCLISDANKFVEDMKPWKLAKLDDKTEFNQVITALCEAIRSISFCLNPYMPHISEKIFSFMNIKGKSFAEVYEDFITQQFNKPEPLFLKEARE